MLAGLFGKKCDHPMADVKSAQQLLDDLPKHDAIKSVTELTEWIESVSVHEEFKFADQYAVLSLLDETAQVYARKLAYEYFSLHDMNVFHGNRLHMVLEALARQTSNAITVCSCAILRPTRARLKRSCRCWLAALSMQAGNS
jgi:hypothetical protein